MHLLSPITHVVFSVIQVQESLIACAKQQSQQLKFCRELASAVARKASSLAGKND